MKIILVIFKQIADSNISLTTVAAEIATTWGFVYALPNFIKQMNIQNQSARASEALNLLPDLRRGINSLLHNSKGDASRDHIIRELIQLFGKIRSFLILLSAQEALNKVDIMLNILNTHNDYDNESKIKFLETIFGSGWGDLMGENKGNTRVLWIDELEVRLQDIYQNPAAIQGKYQLLKDLAILGWCSVIVCCIKIFFPKFEPIFFILAVVVATVSATYTWYFAD